jgi:hypothetical protein
MDSLSLFLHNRVSLRFKHSSNFLQYYLYITAFFGGIPFNFNFTFQLTRTVKVAIASKTSQTFTGIISISIGTVGILMTDTRSFHALVHI